MPTKVAEVEASGGTKTTSSNTPCKEKAMVSNEHAIGAPLKAKEFLIRIGGSPQVLDAEDGNHNWAHC